MRIILVIDSNRLFAALIKDGTTRELLLDEEFEFVAPDFFLEEIEKYKEEIKSKTGLTTVEFELLVSLFLERILIIPQKEYSAYLQQFKIVDIKDIPYLACCLATDAQGVWTHDSDFQKQDQIKIFTNIDLLRWTKKNGSALNSIK